MTSLERRQVKFARHLGGTQRRLRSGGVCATDHITPCTVANESPRLRFTAGSCLRRRTLMQARGTPVKGSFPNLALCARIGNTRADTHRLSLAGPLERGTSVSNSFTLINDSSVASIHFPLRRHRYDRRAHKMCSATLRSARNGSRRRRARRFTSMTSTSAAPKVSGDRLSR